MPRIVQTASIPRFIAYAASSSLPADSKNDSKSVGHPHSVYLNLLIAFFCMFVRQCVRLFAGVYWISCQVSTD